MTVTLVTLSGILLAAGMSCLVVAFARSTPRLDAALERISADDVDRVALRDLGPVGNRSERLGALIYRVVPIPLSAGQRRALRLQDKPIAEFYADKAVMAIVGAILPGLAGGAFAYLTGHLSPIPAVAVVVGGMIGFFVPDLLLRTSDHERLGRCHRGPIGLHRPGDIGTAHECLSHPSTAQRCRPERCTALRPHPNGTGTRAA